MKNKRLTYILIPLVLMIWGVIFYKIYVHISDDEVLLKEKPTERKMEPAKTRDTFVVKANYRDPFLSGQKRQILAVSGIENGGNGGQVTGGFTRHKDPKPEIVIPDLKYFGMIVNANKKQKIGLFRLNNKDAIVKEGELFESFKISKLYNDSVKTTFGKIKKTFKKNLKQN